MLRTKIRRWLRTALILLPMVSTLGYAASVSILQARKPVHKAATAVPADTVRRVAVKAQPIVFEDRMNEDRSTVFVTIFHIISDCG